MSAVQYAPPAPAVHLSAPVAGEVEGWTSSGDKQIFTSRDCLLMEDTTGKGRGARPLKGEASALVIALE